MYSSGASTATRSSFPRCESGPTRNMRTLMVPLATGGSWPGAMNSAVLTLPIIQLFPCAGCETVEKQYVRILSTTPSSGTHDQALVAPTLGRVTRIFRFAVLPGLLRRPASRARDSRAARKSVSLSDRRAAHGHSQAVLEEFLRRAGGGSEVGVDERGRYAPPHARHERRTGASIPGCRPDNHVDDLASGQLGVVVARGHAAAGLSVGRCLQAPARSMGGTTHAQGALAFRGAAGAGQGTAGGFL